MNVLRPVLFTVALTAALPALASIDRVKALQCSGSGTSFTIIFNHDEGRAAVSTAAGTKDSYRYEPDDAFLTWRLVRDDGSRAYVLREGDKINGDLGWYFVATSPGPDGTLDTRTGDCSPVD